MATSTAKQDMEFISHLSTATEPGRIIGELTEGISESRSQAWDVGFVFLSHHSKATSEEIILSLKKHLPLRHLIGCTGGGIIAGQTEIEQSPAASLIVGRLPGVKIIPFSLRQAQLEGLRTPEDWYAFLEIYPNEKPTFFILPDPFQLDMNQFLERMNRAYPGCPVLGGVASGALHPGENTLILNDELAQEGVVGIALSGNISIDTVVSQGCRPIGENFIVTKADGNIILEVAGRPLYDVLREVFQKASPRDKLLAQEAIFVGIAMDEYRDVFKRGDFLIRGLMGIDPATGAGIIGDDIKAGQTIQFQVRDAEAAREDLTALLTSQQAGKNMEKPKGALIFSCNGRGENLFREANHDIKIIQQHIGPVPAAGFFCAGEVGPVCKSNFLHGFTSSIAMFYPPS